MKKTILALMVLMLLSLSINAETIAYWRFENGVNGQKHEGDRDNWYIDQSGNSNHLSTWWDGARPTYTNAVPFATVPVSGATNLFALEFDGNDDLGTFGTNGVGGDEIYMLNSYMFTNGWTMETTFKINSYKWQVVLGKDGQPSADPAATFWFKCMNDGNTRLELLFYDDATNLQVCSTPFELQLDQWYSVAATFDGSVAKLYVKEEGDADYGLEATITDIPGAALGQWNHTWTVGRGMWVSAPVDNIDGRIDEVRISNKALAPTQFLAYAEITVPLPPVIKAVQYSPYPDPDQKDIVTVQAEITTANSTLTNTTLKYRVNSGSYIEIPMVSNTTPNIYYGNIISQAIDTVVDFKIIAINAAGQITTSSVSQYSIKEEILWTTVLVAEDAYYNATSNIFSMAIKSSGLAGFVYSSTASNAAMYVEEDSLGSLKPQVAITTDRQGSYSDLKYGSDDEPRVALADDVGDGGGVNYVQRNGSAWTTPIIAVTNFFGDRRNVMTLVDNAPNILWYEDVTASGQTPLGLLSSGNIAGDTFTSEEVTVPPFPNYPGDLRLPFEIATDSNGKRCIALHGPGYGNDLLYYGVEDSKGSGIFDWEEIPLELTHSNVYADQIGFALDNNDNPYIVLHDYNTNPACAALFYKSSGIWTRKYLSPQGHWNRAAVSYDSWNDCMWVVHNSANEGGNLLRLWSDRSGTWKQEQTVTNDLYIETFSGFEVTDLGVIKLAYTPFVNSPQLIYMYSTTFSDIPEPAIIWIFGMLVTLGIMKTRRNV